MNNSKLPRISLIVSICAIAVSVVAIVLSLNDKSVNISGESKEGDSRTTVSDSLSDIKIAYINLDTLLLEYKLSVQLNEDLMLQQSRSRANLEGQIKQFERDYTNFMEKVQTGSFISQESMESQQKELMEKQQRLERLDQQLSEELMLKQAEMNEQLYDTIMNFMQEYNNGKFNLVLGNAAGSAVLYALPEMNITREVIDALNDRYEARTK
jgi:outer membrane protein